MAYHEDMLRGIAPDLMISLLKRLGALHSEIIVPVTELEACKGEQLFLRYDPRAECFAITVKPPVSPDRAALSE